jgi:ATP dependent DNA ligase-like protein
MTASVFWRGVVLPVWITRSGNDFSSRFPFIAMAVGKLPVWSCLIDGEAIVCDENGLAVFDLIRRHGALASAVHCAFDLLELDGLDLRREPIEMRKELLAERLRGSNLSIVPWIKLGGHQWSAELFAIEPAIRPRPNPSDADYESAKDRSGDQCLADPIALPQTKQGGAHGDYAKKLQRPFDCTCSHEAP